MTRTHPDPDYMSGLAPDVVDLDNMSDTRREAMRERIEHSSVVQTLREEGPQPLDAFDPTYPQRREYVSRFRLSPGGNGKHAINRNGRTGVWYLRDEHTPEEVLDVWLRVNQAVVERADSHRLWHRIRENGPEWGDHFRERVDFEFRAGGGPTEHDATKECPLCGEDELYSLADHLPDCPERGGGVDGA